MASMDSSTTGAAPAQAGKGRRRLTALLTFCSWSYLPAALGLWALLLWADVWWPASIFLFAPRWLCALPLLLFCPAAWLLRRKRLLVPLLLAGVVIAGPVTGLCVPWRTGPPPPSDGMRVRVLTCNLHYSKAADPKGLEALVQESGADVVALQEWQAAEESSLGSGPGWYRHATQRLFLASRFPIRRAISLGHSSGGPDGSVTRYDLETPAGVVHLFSLHLASPREGIYETIHDDWLGAAEVRANIARRWQQSERVAAKVEGLSGPVLLVGDFNTPPESAIFRQVWKDYSDAFAAAGRGWGYTFSGGKTLVRIDHILAGKGWHCTRCWVGPRVGSPHRPVLAELVWSSPTEEAPPP